MERQRGNACRILVSPAGTVQTLQVAIFATTNIAVPLMTAVCGTYLDGLNIQYISVLCDCEIQNVQ